MFAMNALLVGSVVGGGGTKTLTYLGNDGNTSGSFTGCSLGTAAADRRIIVWAGTDGANSSTISAVTVAGVSATKIVENTGRTASAIYIALVPTGTSGTIAVTSSGTARESIAWWGATGLTDNTAEDTATTDSDNSAMTLTTLDGGFAVGGGCHENGSNPTTGGDATQRWSDDASGENGNSGGDVSTDGSSVDITINGINNSRRSACAASF